MQWINIHILEMHSHHICGTDVSVAPCTLYPSTHEGHRNARSLPTIQDKRELAGRREGSWVAGWMVGSWRLNEEISFQLLHFVVPAQEAQWQLQRADILWYIVRETLGQNAKHSWWKSDILFKDHVGDFSKAGSSFPKAGLRILCLFPRMTLWFIERCGAKSS